MSERMKNPEVRPADKVIDVGSVVEIYFVDDPVDETEIIQIIGRHDEGKTGAAKRTVSLDSPLGKAIYGKATEDLVYYEGPGGKILGVKIRSVR